MGFTPIHIQEWVNYKQPFVLLDVRSEGEYAHAHIPQAINLPLFNNEERKIVGTTYKQQSRQLAIKKGLDYFGPKMSQIVCTVEDACTKANTQTVIVHCWRGGMRSAAIAWLLDIYGFKVYTLKGGYKAFRNWALAQFNKTYPLQIIGGFTGSKKTEIIHALKKLGEAAIDLEAIAQHKGSAFGHLGMPQQCSAEMMENKLALELYYTLEQLPHTTTKLIYVESESQRIGNNNLPQAFYNQIKNAPYTFIEVPFENRLEHIVQQYGCFETKDLIAAILRIQKRLGGLATKQAINFLLEKDITRCFTILLQYYDKYYTKSSRDNRTNINTLAVTNETPTDIAYLLLKNITHE